MSAVTVKKPYGCGDKEPPEPLSPAAQWDEKWETAQNFPWALSLLRPIEWTSLSLQVGFFSI